MSVPFLQLPINLRLPGIYSEIDASRAGAFSQRFRAHITAQKLSTGVATVDVPVLVTARNADQLFGIGSMAAFMAKKFRERNAWTPLYVTPIADNGAGVAASGTVNFGGSSAVQGTLYFYVGGKRLVISAPGWAAAQLAASLRDAINAEPSLLVTATASSTTTTITCRHKGTIGNQIDLRWNALPGESFPAVGTFVGTITPMAGGSGDPTNLDVVIANLDGTKYNVFAWPYNDDPSLDLIEAELETRWGPMVDLGGVAVTGKADTLGNHQTALASRNSGFLTYLALASFPGMAIERVAEVAAHLAFEAEQDPAKPYWTLPLGGYAPSDFDRFTPAERNTLLLDGGATLGIGPSGEPIIERLVSTRTLNAAGSADSAFLDINVALTVDYLRESWKARMSSRFARKKLAAKLTDTNASPDVVTPGIARAESDALYDEWMARGLVQDKKHFQENSSYEVNATEPTRLDCILAPKLVNPLYQAAALVQFQR